MAFATWTKALPQEPLCCHGNPQWYMSAKRDLQIRMNFSLGIAARGAGTP